MSPGSSCLRPGLPGRLAIFLLCFLFCAKAGFASENLLLTLKDRDGKELYCVPAQNGSEFAIRYTHSVALTPVTDYFVIRDNAIWLDKTEYEDFGAGLPHAPEDGQIMHTEKGKISISGYKKRLDSFQLRVGRVAGHQLLVKIGNESRTVPLEKISEPGSAITFSIVIKNK